MSGQARQGRNGVDEAGFLLVEVLVAIVIAGWAILTITHLWVRLEVAAAAVRHQATALRIAEDRLEGLRLRARRPATRPSTSGRWVLGPPGSGSDEERPGLERRYRSRWRVTRRRPPLQALEVEVDWNEWPGPDGHRNIVLKTLVDALPVHRPLNRR